MIESKTGTSVIVGLSLWKFIYLFLLSISFIFFECVSCKSMCRSGFYTGSRVFFTSNTYKQHLHIFHFWKYDMWLLLFWLTPALISIHHWQQTPSQADGLTWLVK